MRYTETLGQMPSAGLQSTAAAPPRGAELHVTELKSLTIMYVLVAYAHTLNKRCRLFRCMRCAETLTPVHGSPELGQYVTLYSQNRRCRDFCCMRYPETLSKTQCQLVSSSCVVRLSRPLNRLTRCSQVAHSSSMGSPQGS